MRTLFAFPKEFIERGRADGSANEGNCRAG
jgi:hypothetical protein